MAKYTVTFETVASLTVNVEVDDNLDEDEAKEAAVEEAWNSAPSTVCAQCSGWRQKWTLDLGEWEVGKDPTTGVEYVEKAED